MTSTTVTELQCPGGLKPVILSAIMNLGLNAILYGISKAELRIQLTHGPNKTTLTITATSDFGGSNLTSKQAEITSINQDVQRIRAGKDLSIARTTGLKSLAWMSQALRRTPDWSLDMDIQGDCEAVTRYALSWTATEGDQD